MFGSGNWERPGAKHWSGAGSSASSRAEQWMLSTGWELGCRHRTSKGRHALSRRFLNRLPEDWYSQRVQPPREPLSLFNCHIESKRGFIRSEGS
ncbi:hypothetical protein U1Q18_021671 [Sarracenia purpurea var. burkii]